jgi:hypothetical protein
MTARSVTSSSELTPPGADELLRLVQDPGRHIFVAKEPLDFRNLENPNEIYVVEFPAQRRERAVKAYHYRSGAGECVKVGEVEDPERLESLELPDGTTISIVLPDGTQKLVPGIADGDLVRDYSAILD